MIEEEQAYLKTSQLDKVYKIMTSNQFAISMMSMTAKGDMENVGEGGAYPFATQQEGYKKAIYNEDEWKLAMAITETMVEDAEIFDPVSFAKDFMLPYVRTREKFGAALFNGANAATVTFGGKVYNTATADAVALFSTAHTSKTGKAANQSNYFNAAFTYDNLLTVEEYMQKVTDDDGNLMNIQPDTIIIPNNARIKKLVYDAVFTTSGRPDTGNNSTNMNADRWNVVVWNQLSNPSSATSDIWYLADSKRNQIDGSLFVDRTPLKVTDWKDNNSGNLVFGGRARYTAGFNNWRGLAGAYPGVGGTSI
jgi:hypothetical protein